MIKTDASVSRGWLNREAGFTFPGEYYFDSGKRLETDSAVRQYLMKRFGSDRPGFRESNLVQPEFEQPGDRLIGGIQPNLILGMLLGAELTAPPHLDPDLDRIPLEGTPDTADLPDPESLTDHPLIKQWTEELKRAGESGLPVIPPFFWDRSGRATIHGIVTTSLKLAGEGVMLDFVLQPEKVLAFHDWITRAWIVLIRHFADLVSFPVTALHVGECSGTMVSESDYRQFILPYLSRLSEEIAPLRLHHCGNCDHLLPAIAEIPRLAVLDTGSGASVAKIREILGADREIHIAPPVEMLLEGASEEALAAWCRQTEEENRKGPMMIAMHIEPGYSLDLCLKVLNRSFSGT